MIYKYSVIRIEGERNVMYHLYHDISNKTFVILIEGYGLFVMVYRYESINKYRRVYADNNWSMYKGLHIPKNTKKLKMENDNYLSLAYSEKAIEMYIEFEILNKLINEI